MAFVIFGIIKITLTFKTYKYTFKASRALRETVGLDRAVASAVDLVNTEETLIVVTADHSHTLAIGGYNDRFADITREVQRK